MEKPNPKAAGTGAPPATLHGAGVEGAHLEVVEPGQEPAAAPQPAPVPEGVPQVYAALAEALRIVGIRGVGKQGKNKDQGYAFRSIDQVYGEVNRAMAAAGLVIIPHLVKHERTEHKTAKGGTIWHVDAWVKFTAYARDGSSVEIGPFLGEAFDTSDKATNKAMTAAYKYMLIEIYCIPLVGIDDADDHTPESDGRKESERRARTPGGDGNPYPDSSGAEDEGNDIERISAEQVKAIRDRLAVNAIPEATFCRAGGIEALEDLGKESYDQAFGWIAKFEKKLAERAAKSKEQAGAGTTIQGEAKPAEPVDPHPAGTVRAYVLKEAGDDIAKATVSLKAKPVVDGLITDASGQQWKIAEILKLDSGVPVIVASKVPGAPLDPREDQFAESDAKGGRRGAKKGGE